jgi:uncharacterized protein (TIGR02145 family)
MKKVLSIGALITILSLMVIFQGCKKATVPELTTVAVTQITLNSAVSGGTIISDGGEDITEKGVCWSKTTSPTIADSKTIDGTGSASFTSNMVGLAEGDSYFVRAYATNSVGTSYGDELTFTTDQVTAAAVTTTEATTITPTSAVAGGNVTDDGGGTVTARGVCWSNTKQIPTTADNVTPSSGSTGNFASNITGLENGTVYYYCAFATNSFGTTYGEIYHFITPVADIEGNVYQTVKIGTQVWMAENLKVKKLNDNTEITYIFDNTEWSTQVAPAYCWYNNDEDFFKPLYGALYNWHSANSEILCPTGWHVPTDADWNILEVGLGLSEADANEWGWRGSHAAVLKNVTDWNVGENGTNTSGFSALPGGFRYYLTGGFDGRLAVGYWWSSDENGNAEGWYRMIKGSEVGVYRASTQKEAGKSIRCIKD